MANLQQCECEDRECPDHKGEVCPHRIQHPVILYRIDMEDQSGTAFCTGCAADALDSGVFSDISPREA